ncbi:PAS domain-containing sensor histidine kinase [Cylindrospermum stagnale]|nr:PAS domain-containing sensor histidine kinase [Cylindrospermum stagnale]
MTTLLKKVQRWWKKALWTPTTEEVTAVYQANLKEKEWLAFRDRFLWQRLHLWLWLGLICLLSFTLRNIYDYFSPLKELVKLPLRTQGLAINFAMLLILLVCFALHKTKFGRRRPGLLFLGSSWSISLSSQLFATLKGFALPDTLGWSLLFLSQATFMPVRWRLHLLSQLVVLVYYFGVNWGLRLKTIWPNHPEIYNVTFILYVFWLCAICDVGVYLYDCLQRSEFYARRELESAYQKLETAEVKYRSIFENAVEGIFQSSSDGRYITANPALARIYGYSLSEEVTVNFTDIEHQLYVDPQRRAEFIRLIEVQGSISEFESQIYRRDGSIVWISEKAYAVRDEKGNLLYYEGLIEDITQRKQAEEALQEQFNFLQILIDTIPAPVYYKNSQGIYLGCNTAFAASLGLSKGQIIGKSVYDLAPKDLADQYHQADIALFEQQQVQSYESSLVYADRTQHDVIFYKATFSKADGSLGGLVGVILDISTRKRTEEALRVFFHAVSHDLRNPVLGTLMVLRNLLLGGGLGTGGEGRMIEFGSPSSIPNTQSLIPVSRSILQRMEQSGDRQLNLINSLMEAHKSEVQGVVLQRQPIQLHTVVADAIADLEPMLVENQATLTNLVTVQLPTVNADSLQLWRVFSNLIVNALKHNPPGLFLQINAINQEDKIYCTVSDNGIGISPEQSVQLFDLYYRSSNIDYVMLRDRNSVSLGLGLYLCKQIINAHGGEIGVNTGLETGVTFWFTLPITAK